MNAFVRSLVLIFLLSILTTVTAQNWQYARLTTNIVGGGIVASWTSPTEKVTAEAGILVLAERIMGQLISDTDDAFIVFMNYLGQQGWELVWVDTNGKKKDYLFKRLEPSVLITD